MAAVAVAAIALVAVAAAAGSALMQLRSMDALRPVPSATPSPDATDALVYDAMSGPPRVPKAMKKPDSAGAQAAAVYFMELMAEGLVSGDAEPLAALSHPDCSGCFVALADIAAIGILALEGDPEPPLATLTAIRTIEDEPGASWWVTLAVGSSERDGAAGGGSAREPVELGIGVVHEDGRWLITDLVPDSAS